MTLRDNIALALSSIRGNFLRTILTFLIIAFGIMALVGILTAADGIKASLQSNFATMGANNFTIRKGGKGIHVHRKGRAAKKDFKDFELDQALDFKERFTYPAAVSISNVVSYVSTIKYESEKTNPTIRLIGADENYLAVTGYDVEWGRNFSEIDANSGRSVVLLGNDVAKKLFTKTEKALDKIISINNRKYKVLGVLAPKGSSSIFSSDNVSVIPLLNAKSTYGSERKSYAATVSIQDTYGLDAAISEATGLMRNIRKLRFNE
ncbi:MAG: ABC transporter permease, partial [Chitinophagales bacterium]